MIILMAFCLRCQDFTTNLNSNTTPFSKYQLRQRAICSTCGRRKSCFLSRDGKRKRELVADGQDEQRVAKEIERMKQFDSLLERNIRSILHHQWCMDHVPGYRISFRQKKEI